MPKRLLALTVLGIILIFFVACGHNGSQSYMPDNSGSVDSGYGYDTPDTSPSGLPDYSDGDTSSPIPTDAPTPTPTPTLTLPHGCMWVAGDSESSEMVCPPPSCKRVLVTYDDQNRQVVYCIISDLKDLEDAISPTPSASPSATP